MKQKHRKLKTSKNANKYSNMIFQRCYLIFQDGLIILAINKMVIYVNVD